MRNRNALRILIGVFCLLSLCVGMKEAAAADYQERGKWRTDCTGAKIHHNSEARCHIYLWRPFQTGTAG